ncbi:hypothetical protein AGMMS49938_14020 [Fibrobacterales bacterium]|nr:hypothetical protein AGMMS49938_14020 [Fibrobacterales bacterium]
MENKKENSNYFDLLNKLGRTNSFLQPDATRVEKPNAPYSSSFLDAVISLPKSSSKDTTNNLNILDFVANSDSLPNSSSKDTVKKHKIDSSTQETASTSLTGDENLDWLMDKWGITNPKVRDICQRRIQLQEIQKTVPYGEEEWLDAFYKIEKINADIDKQGFGVALKMINQFMNGYGKALK